MSAEIPDSEQGLSEPCCAVLAEIPVSEWGLSEPCCAVSAVIPDIEGPG